MPLKREPLFVGNTNKLKILKRTLETQMFASHASITQSVKELACLESKSRTKAAINLV